MSRERFWFRSLATLLAWVMILPPVAQMTGSKHWQAKAQSGCGPQPNAILRNICGSGIIDDLVQFEADAVQDYLASHGLPASDANIIYSYGRLDLRSEIRSMMVLKIVDIVQRHYGFAASPHEERIYNWFLTLMWNNEKSMYQKAVDDRNSWASNPCAWRPDADVASKYGLKWDPVPYCVPPGSNLNALFTIAPQIPAASYYLAAANYHVYGQPLANDPNGVKVQQYLTSNLGIGLEAAALVGLGIATGFGVAVASASTAAAIFTTAVTGNLFLATGVTAAGAGAGGIIAFAVLIGIVAAFEVADAQKVQDDLNNLDNLNTNAHNFAPDLRESMKNGDGMNKMIQTLEAVTLPEVIATAVPPSHRDSDAAFLIQPQGSSSSSVSTTLSYKDWNGGTWNASAYGGWFTQSDNSSPAHYSITPTLYYKDWSGTNFLASRLANDQFLIAKAQPSTTDTSCNLSNVGSGSTTCFVSAFVNLTNSQNQKVTISLQSAPQFTSPDHASFSDANSPSDPGGTTTQTFNITAVGNPTPTITFTSTPNAPSIILRDSNSVGAGHAQMVFDAEYMAPGIYTYQLKAQSQAGAVTQTLTVAVATGVTITSGNAAGFTYGFPGSFTITTTGFPYPSIVLDTPLALPPGLSIRRPWRRHGYNQRNRHRTGLPGRHRYQLSGPGEEPGLASNTATGRVRQSCGRHFFDRTVAGGLLCL